MRLFTVIEAACGWTVVGPFGDVYSAYPDLEEALYQGAKAQSHMTWEECAERWPRLTRVLQWVLVGTQSEAACCIRDYRDGMRYGGEAVSHSGLSPEDRVRQAVDARRVVRLIYGRA